MIRQIPYPITVVVEGTGGFVASFQDRLTLLSPINEGVFECNGWIVINYKMFSFDLMHI